jgi:asparagine synthase (glutamine-hydrolysing)
MCGICGIVDYSGEPIDRAIVDRMRDVMRRRGPDDAGTEVLPYVGLGHRRLSILDLSPRGHQPMSNEDGRVHVVFNGEIYDFKPLRQLLQTAGHRFKSESDTEVLVHGYEEWGIEGLASRINGMFAAAIWDARSRELHLLRDRLGKKPLYYGWHAGRFLFASELKAIWTVAEGVLRPRPESIARYLYWGYLPGRETVFESVYQLLPARILTLRCNGTDERRYWRLSYANKTLASTADILDRTDAIVTDAVRRRLRSDVPLGAFLSGGVDSSYVVSRMVACRQSDEPVRTFAMGTSERAHDERSHARQVAEHCGTNHTEFEVTPEAWSLLPRLVWEFGQPFGDPACIPTYYVAEQARKYVTVALTGDGGDEAFAGYSQHLGRHLGTLIKPMLPTSVLNQLLERSHPLLDDGGDSRLSAAARFLHYVHPDPLVNWGAVSMWAQHHLHRLWAPRYRSLTDPENLLGYALEVDADFDGSTALDRALHFDANVLLPFGYNVKVDVATMMSSLEARCPFQDWQVVEWAASIPSALHIQRYSSKALLKQVAERSLPREVVYRQKHGFSVPIDEWFRGAWAPAARRVIFSDRARERGYFDFDYLERLWGDHAAGRARHGIRLWTLLWLEIWLQMFVEGAVSTSGPNPQRQWWTLPETGLGRGVSVN